MNRILKYLLTICLILAFALPALATERRRRGDDQINDPCSNLPISSNGLIFRSEPNCPRGRGSAQILPDTSGYGRDLEQTVLANQAPLYGSGRGQGRWYIADNFMPQRNLVNVALGAALTGVTLSMVNGNAQISADPTVVDLTQHIGKAVYVWDNSGVLTDNLCWGILGPVESGSSVWVTSGTGVARTWTNNGLAAGFNPINPVGFTLKIRDPSFNVTGPFTWEGMVSFTEGHPVQPKNIASKADSGLVQTSWSVYLLATGALQLRVSATGGATKDQATGVLFPAGSIGWQHIVFIYTGAGAKIYLNGIERATTGDAFPTSLFDTPAPFMLGGRYSSGAVAGAWEGGIGGNSFWSRAWTGSEAVTMYNWRR